MLYDGESCCLSKSYHLHIVDRVGGGTDAQMPEFTQSVSKPTPTKATSEKEFEPYTPKIRKSGTGCVYKVNDSLWEGSYYPRMPDGKRKKFNIYAKTREECEKALEKMIEEKKKEIAKLKKKAKEAEKTA